MRTYHNGDGHISEHHPGTVDAFTPGVGADAPVTGRCATLSLCTLSFWSERADCGLLMRIRPIILIGIRSTIDGTICVGRIRNSRH